MKTELKVELTMFYPRSYSTMEAKYVVFPWLWVICCHLNHLFNPSLQD